MGAAAAKQLHSEKAKHAAAVLNAVQSFEETLGDNGDEINRDPELFKRRVLLAAADAKKNGNDIENSLAQLSDADIESLCHYVENQKDEEAFVNKSLSMKIEEIVDDENNGGADNIDETTSVLSYGDDEVPDNESEEESGSGFARVAAPVAHNLSSLISISKDEHDESSGDEVDEQVDSDTVLHSRAHLGSAVRRGSSNGVRVFPIGGDVRNSPVKSSRGSPRSSRERRPSASERIAQEEKLMLEDDETPRTPKIPLSLLAPTSSGSRHSSANAANKLSRQSPAPCHSPLGLILPPSMAEKYARIWEPDPTEGLLTTSSSMAFDSPAHVGAASRASPAMHKYKFNAPSGGGGVSGSTRPVVYKDLGERIDERNDALMGLQRQKVISYTQNAQLEREVEALQRQLEKMDQLDRDDNRRPHQQQHVSSVETISSSSYSTTTRHRQQQQHVAQQFSHIYPIDEESHSLRQQQHRGAVHSDANDFKHQFLSAHSPADSKQSSLSVANKYHSRQQSNGTSRYHKHGSSSSSDTDNSSIQQSQQQQSHHLVQRYYADGTSSIAQEKSSKNISHLPKRHSEGKAVMAESIHSDYIPSMPLHSSPPPMSSVTAVGSGGKPKQHVAPSRRRVRTGLGGIVNGNSSGFDSDDSASAAAGSTNHHSGNKVVVSGSAASEWRFKETQSSHTGETSTHSTSRDKRISNGGAGMLDHSGEMGTGMGGKHRRTPSNVTPEHHHQKHSSFKQHVPSEDESDNGSPVQQQPTKKLQGGVEGNRATRHRRLTSDETTSATVGVSNSSHNRHQVDEDSNSVASKPTIVGRGGALKKLNRRRHSLDGSGDALHDESSAASQEDNEDHRRGNMRHEPRKTDSHHHQQTADASVVSIASSTATSPSSTTVSAAVPSNRIVLTNKAGARRRVSGDSVTNSNSNNNASNTKTALATARDLVQAVGAAVAAVADPVVESQHQLQDETPVVVASAATREKRRQVGRAQVVVAPKQQVPATVEESSSLSLLWNSQLDNSWAEVSLLLRKPIKSEADMQYTVAAAEAGILFVEQMDNISKTIHVLRGALSRWLLPYDNNTRIDMQCSTPHSVVENMPDEFRGKLTERQVHYLVAGANGVRQLVRVKIADDNDLEQARTALITIDRFFKLLYHVAAGAGMTPYQLLQANC